MRSIGDVPVPPSSGSCTCSMTKTQVSQMNDRTRICLQRGGVPTTRVFANNCNDDCDKGSCFTHLICSGSPHATDQSTYPGKCKKAAVVTPFKLGACCMSDGSCLRNTQAQCYADGGTYIGDDTSCSPDPCEGPVEEEEK